MYAVNEVRDVAAYEVHHYLSIIALINECIDIKCTNTEC
jgi:hypothetical protein